MPGRTLGMIFAVTSNADIRQAAFRLRTGLGEAAEDRSAFV